MKILFSILSLIALSTFAQQIVPDEDGYVEIPDLSKEIKVEGKGIEIGSLKFMHIPEYTYKDGIVYGSYVKITMENVENVNMVGDESFVFYKHVITRKSDEKVLIETDWDAEKIDEKSEGESDTLLFNATWEIGAPTYAGEYTWEVHLLNFCNKKVTKVSVPVTIVKAENIAYECTDGVSAAQIYFWNDNKKYIYAGTKIYQGDLQLKVRNINGFKMDEGLYKIGVSHKLVDQSGKVLFENQDMATGKDAFVESADGTLMVSPSMTLKSDVKGQVLTYSVRIWDKRQLKAEINILTKFYVN